MLKRKNEIIGFVGEVTSFMITGFCIAKQQYIGALFFITCSLILAFTVGGMIYDRGVTDGSSGH